MNIHGWTRRLPLVCLVAMAAGCQTVPPLPTDPFTRPDDVSAKRNNYDDTDGDGWLLNRLFGANGTDAKTADDDASTPKFDPNVKQAGAVQPMPSLNDPNASKRGIIYLADDADLDVIRDPDEAKDKDDSLSLFGWLPTGPEEIYKNAKTAVGLGPDRKLAKQYLDEGLKLYEEKQFTEAAAKFKAAAGRWPDSALEEDALFLQGESLFFADNYPKSQDTFDILLKKHDNTRHLEKVMIRQFAIARYWEQLHRHDPKWVTTPNLIDRKRPLFDTLGNARKAYETVVLHDPTGPLADDALMALANSDFVRARYEDAAEYYDRLRKEHPNSPHIMDAHLLLVKSKQLLYQGSLYDASPLNDADEAAEQTLRQFGAKLGEEQAKLIELRGKFEREMAERDWAMARFYEGKKLYGAARLYYGYIMKDYPSTDMAKAARERIEAIKDYPDKPPNHFKFLTDLFPDGR